MGETLHERIVFGWPEEQRALFPPEHFLHRAETRSTNDDLAELARTEPPAPFRVLAADYQTAGRGRRGDRWHAPRGRNLLFSLQLELAPDHGGPAAGPGCWSRLPLLVGAALGAAVESVLVGDSPVELKWPNDLLIDGKKIAGILVETQLAPRPVAIAGMGLNVNSRPSEFPEELRDIATSLYQQLGCESDRWYLLGLFLERMLDVFPRALEDFGPTLAWIRERDHLREKAVTALGSGQRTEGIARGVSESGALRVEREDGKIEEVVSCESLRVDGEETGHP